MRLPNDTLSEKLGVMTETEKYVRRFLKKDFDEVRASAIAGVRNGLDIYEKTLIYYYTASGYRAINQSLRRFGGHAGSRAAILLQEVLRKLPDWRGPVFRAANLTKSSIAVYKKCALAGSAIMETAFLSTSRSPHKIEHYPATNVTYHIFARHGKAIESCSRLGSVLPPNEEEVLLLPRSKFWVLDVNESSGNVLIILEEAE